MDTTSLEDELAALSKAQLSERITQLDRAAQALPSSSAMAVAKSAITAEIAMCKQRIALLRPIGARMDACKAALARANKRVAEAQETVNKAQRVLDAAVAEETSLRGSLAALELEVANAPSQAQPPQVAADEVLKIFHQFATSAGAPQDLASQVSERLLAILHAGAQESTNALSASAQAMLMPRPSSGTLPVVPPPPPPMHGTSGYATPAGADIEQVPASMATDPRDQGTVSDSEVPTMGFRPTRQRLRTKSKAAHIKGPYHGNQDHATDACL